MIGLKLGTAKPFFFDRAAIQNAVTRAERRVFSKFGAYVRQDAKQRIRRRKRASRPGESPTNQTGLLKRHIYFVFDPQQRSVVIGPIRLSRGTDAPANLEHGGQVELMSRKHQKQTVSIAPRPYMGPAFDKQQTQLPAMWRDSVK